MNHPTVSDFEPDSSLSAGSSDDEPPEPGAADQVADPGLRAVLVLATADTDPPLVGWLEGCFDQLLDLAGAGDAELTLAVVDDARMAELHEQYCGESGTTDVLTFDLRERPNEPPAGDIVICLDEAARQAAERGHATRVEVLLYALHGLLHLLGYDDHTPAEHAAMHRREDALLSAIGVGPVYEAGGQGTDE
jgi:probable rRNA maturation factor